MGDQCSAGKFVEQEASQCQLDTSHKGAHYYVKGVMGVRVDVDPAYIEHLHEHERGEFSNCKYCEAED